MELFAHPVIAIVLLLGILVIVHEAGHFFVGVFFKIPVEVFSIGFGPTLFSLRRGETEYRLSAIPLGGFVKFYGSLPSEEVPDAIRGREYYRAPIHARFLTIAAGPIANILLAIVVFAAMVMYGIRLPPAVIGEMSPGSPAERAGLQFGDQIATIDGREVHSWKDVQRFIGDAPERNIELEVRRGNETVALRLAPEAVKDEDLPGTRGRIGISRVMVPTVLTHFSNQGFLAEAGLETGDRLLNVAWNGQEREIRYWQQFVR
ncbi:MAG: RIP metalloprotease RseP, partial [Oligoflexus sp.]